ncbi:Uncharacterised protein [Exiguobacterium aurantiacum]|uniref:Uncharacterized protein n=1 Tax=Exiguobacterium aurantiacum TaxID=33987 RepID=A0A377HH34_9BACL|nr:Uncharacterised protein [Exiguobacterium aurantiacum]
MLGFQVEHEDTIEPTSLNNRIFSILRQDERHADLSDNELNELIDQMDAMEKEKHIPNDLYERDEHIQKVIHKMFRPDNAYTKFDFKNGAHRSQRF